jgi:hypothetical protein
MPSTIKWTTLLELVRGADGRSAPPELAQAAVDEFYSQGKRPPYGWMPCWMDHESERRPWTGPRSPRDVDWNGFQGSRSAFS